MRASNAPLIAAGACIAGATLALTWRRFRKKIELGKAIFSNKWFSEFGTMWPGQAFSLEIKEELHEEQSKYQNIKVFESTNHGTVLVLDGVIQCTTFDEFSYQEMMAHVPLMAHPCPKRVLIVGGGDGGVVREVCRHSCVQSVDLCELDEAVIRVSKKYFPDMTVALETDSRVQIHLMDGFKFFADAAEGSYDVIIVDSSDPVGPAEVIFTEPFYRLMHRALAPDGIAATQVRMSLESTVN